MVLILNNFAMKVEFFLCLTFRALMSWGKKADQVHKGAASVFLEVEILQWSESIYNFS